MNQKVLLVEDDPTMRSLLKTFLELEGYQVFFADEEREETILEYSNKLSPVILILDVNLQQANGIDVLKKLRQEDQLSGVRILMTSGLDVEQQCLDAGADGFLLKPYNPDELINLLRRLS